MSRSREELEAEAARFEELLDSGVREQLMALPGVVHVTFGLKQAGDRVIDEFSVKVYVERKVPAAELAPEHVVPATVAGVPTDVSEVPTAKTQSTVVGGTQITNGINERISPGVFEFTGGTLGFIALRNDKDSTPVMLSCAHIMGARTGKVGDPIFQPTPGPDPINDNDTFPRHPRTAVNTVGTTVAMVTTSTTVDCAIAAVGTCYSCCCNCGTGYSHQIAGLAVGGGDGIAGTAVAVAGQAVVKVGRSTNRTTGVVVGTNTPVKIADFFGAPRIFTNQIEIAGDPGVQFSLDGDSGSMIVGTDGKVVGMLFSGTDPPPVPGPDPSTSHTFANQIAEVLTVLNIRLPATADQPGAALAGFRADHLTAPLADAPGFLAELTDRLGRSAVGRRLLTAIERHGRDVVGLVNHNRRVKVAWHRGQGPAWLAAFARSVRHPGYRLPTEIDAVTRADAISGLRAALLAEGDDELRAVLLELPEFVQAALTDCDTVEQLLRLVEHEPAPTNG